MPNSTAQKMRLEKMLADITEELKAVGIHNPKNPQDWIAVPRDLDAEEPDLNIAADAVEEWDERRALVAALETRYNNIVAALVRVDDGTYGTCDVCGKPIEEKRLEANPAAATCMTHLDGDTDI